MELLTVKNLSFSYPERDEKCLTELSFSVNAGEFCVLCGATGSGKSTLLRLIKREIAPLGTRTGEILLGGIVTDALSERDAATRIGFVMQDPERQIVTDKVFSELAFGLESLGLARTEIARRVAEMASYFGIEEWYEKPISLLSGGQRQLVALAAVMVTDPDILILDEPTSQLDPIAASDFIRTLKKLNDDFGLTVLIAEHRLEELIPISDRLIALDEGKVLANAAPSAAIGEIGLHSALFSAMPSAARLYRLLGEKGDCPLTVKEGRCFLRASFSNNVREISRRESSPKTAPALEFSGVYFRYERHSDDVLRGMELTVHTGEIFCLLGGNGSGKTTALSIAAGLDRPYAGRVRVFGKNLRDYKDQTLYRECLSLLPQDVQTVFLKNTVREELADAGATLADLPYDLSHLMERHPYDLSGGEQQLVALAKVLATKPRLLLMDEPTKGLDAEKKANLCDVLRALKARGVTVVIVTHDVEFAAGIADRCALIFGGRVVSEGAPEDFFSQNKFYTTAVCRMARGYYDRAVTMDALLALCAANAREEGSLC